MFFSARRRRKGFYKYLHGKKYSYKIQKNAKRAEDTLHLLSTSLKWRYVDKYMTETLVRARARKPSSSLCQPTKQGMYFEYHCDELHTEKLSGLTTPYQSHTSQTTVPSERMMAWVFESSIIQSILEEKDKLVEELKQIKEKEESNSFQNINMNCSSSRFKKQTLVPSRMINLNDPNENLYRFAEGHFHRMLHGNQHKIKSMTVASNPVLQAAFDKK